MKEENVENTIEVNWRINKVSTEKESKVKREMSLTQRQDEININSLLSKFRNYENFRGNRTLKEERNMKEEVGIIKF